MSKPFFSILIPVYNTSKSLAKCLDSVLSQSFDDYEVIVIDDGSTDESAKILESYGEKIKVVTNSENSGLVTTRIHGMQNATGQYIINLDSDDYLRPGALRIIFNHISETSEKYDITEYGYVRDPEGVKVIHEKDTDDRLYKLLIHEYPPTVWNKCYSASIVKKALEKAEEFYCVFSEDCYFSILFNVCGATYDYINDEVMHYVAVDGVTAKVLTDSQLDRSILSLTNSYNHVKELIEKNAPKYAEHLERFKMHSVQFLRKQATNEAIPYEQQFEFLKKIDVSFEAGYVNELFDSSNKYLSYMSLGRKGKIAACWKEIWRVLLGK